MTTATMPMSETVAGPVTMPRLLLSEWTKFRSLRSSWWSIATAAALTIGLGVIISLAAAADQGSSELPTNVALRTELGTILAQLALGTLAVLFISGEYGTGMVRSSMTVVPKRLPVLWAKLAVYTAVVLPISVLTSVVTFLLGQVVWQAKGRTAVSLFDAGVPRIVFGAALYLTVAGLCAAAIGALLRSTAAAVTVMVGMFFVLPTLWQAMPAQIAGAGRFLPSNAGAAVADLATVPHPLAPWTGLGLLCVYAAILMVAAAWRLRRTDV